jgi:hypothetical protein
MTLTLRNVQLDCPADRFDAAVGFWAAALGAEVVAVAGHPWARDDGADDDALAGGVERSTPPSWLRTFRRFRWWDLSCQIILGSWQEWLR